MIKTINGATSIEELQTVVSGMFNNLDKNLKESSNRVQELEQEIAKRGTDNLEAIRLNTQDQVELEQVRVFYEKQLSKRNTLVNEYSRTISDKVEALQRMVDDDYNKKHLAKATKEVLKLWGNIQSIEQEYNDKKRKANKDSLEQAKWFKHYLNEDRNRYLDNFMFFRTPGYDVPFMNMLKEDLKRLNELAED